MSTKWFRVAKEGPTTDGRHISREHIGQMAATYNPSTYGARIWLEHFRGLVPGGPFDALGDIRALKTEIDGDTMYLSAQIDPLPSLQNFAKSRQKIFSSIEFDPNFAQTGQAYLVGLGVTDSPASLGTSVLNFSQAMPHMLAPTPAGAQFAPLLELPASAFSDQDQQQGLFASALAALGSFMTQQNAAATTTPAAPAQPAFSAATTAPPPAPQAQPSLAPAPDAFHAAMQAFCQSIAAEVTKLSQQQAELSAKVINLGAALDALPAPNAYARNPGHPAGAPNFL